LPAAGLISEILILLIFDGFLFARGHVTASPLNLVNAFKGFPAQGRLAAGAIGIGLFFASLAGYPSTHAAIAASQTNAASYFLTPATRYAGHWVSSVMSYLIITGSFACGMAFHNTTARYLYSLGREGLAPKALGRTHPKWKSPHIASVTQSVIAAVTRRRGALVEDPASPADLVLLPGLRGVPAVHQHLVPRRRVQLRELAGTD
jgi:amino acid transporter